MADYSNHDLDTGGEKARADSENHIGNESASETIPAPSPADSHSMLREASIGACSNSPVRAAALRTMQQTHGNRAVQRYIQRAKSQQAVPVQRFGLGDAWDAIKKIGSPSGDAMQSDSPPTSDQPLVGPVVMGDNLAVPMTRVGPVVMGDNLAVPGMFEDPQQGQPDYRPPV